MNKSNDMNDNNVRRYGAIEEDRDAQNQFEAAGQTNDGVTNNPQSSVPVHTEPPLMRRPTARTLARGFKSFRPAVFLQKYRTAKAARFENFRARQPYTFSKLSQDERSDGPPVVGWKGRFTNFLSRLLPIAAVIGNWHLLEIGFLPLLGILLIAMLFVCLGGVAILNIVRR